MTMPESPAVSISHTIRRIPLNIVLCMQAVPTATVGKQNRVEHCPHYCEKYAFLYPDHLKMIGKGNSLFAFDLEILRNQEILRNYREQGVDRLVIHLL